MAERVTGQESSVLTAPAKSATEGAVQPLAADTAAKAPAWVAQLEGDLQKDEKLTQFKSISELGKAYRELEGKLTKGVTVPSEGASADEWAAFRKAIGVPEKPEDYKLDEVKLPNGETLDPEWDKGLKAVAHKFNISQGQLNELHKWYFADLAEAMKFVKTTAQQAHATLRREMGADYEAAMTCKARAVNKFLSPEAATRFEKTGLGNDPEIIKMFAAIGKAMGDHFFAEATRGEKPVAGTFGRRTDEQLAQALYPDKK